MKKIALLLLLVLCLPYISDAQVHFIRLRSSQNPDFMRIVMEGSEDALGKGVVLGGASAEAAVDRRLGHVGVGDRRVRVLRTPAVEVAVGHVEVPRNHLEAPGVGAVIEVVVVAHAEVAIEAGQRHGGRGEAQERVDLKDL